MDDLQLNSFIETKQVRARTETKAANVMPDISKKIAPILSLYLHGFKLHTVHVVPRCRAPNPCLPQQQDTIAYVVKNLSLTLLKMGKI